jgi:endonuclease/exonuclease/phosphatase family metal-dependent hydrolase
LTELSGWHCLCLVFQIIVLSAFQILNRYVCYKKSLKTVRIFITLLVLLVTGSPKCFAQKRKPKAAPIAIKVLTYNIHHGVSENGKTNLLRVVDLIKQHQPDLVALQEVDSGVTRSGRLNQLRILSLLTGYETYMGKAIDLQGGKYGLGILSKLPLETTQLIKLPNPDSTEQRILFCGLLSITEGRYLRFCNVHLDNKSPLNRGLQAAVVNEALKNSIYPVILAGDFNATTDDHTIEAITKYWKDAGQDSDIPTYPSANKRIDYFWTLDHSGLKLAEYRVLNESGVSDHQPILVTYLLEK